MCKYFNSLWLEVVTCDLKLARKKCDTIQLRTDRHTNNGKTVYLLLRNGDFISLKSMQQSKLFYDKFVSLWLNNI